MHSKYELEMLAIELYKQYITRQSINLSIWNNTKREVRESFRKIAQQMLEENEYNT